MLLLYWVCHTDASRGQAVYSDGGGGSSMTDTDTSRPPAGTPAALRIPAGADYFGEKRSLGVSTLSFKVSTHDSGGLFVVENTFHAKGGPARHLHYAQDEWFYVLDGEFLIEIGEVRFSLHPGDSILAPRQVPHVWASVGDMSGRIMIAFQPAGKMEAFFRIVTQANAMPPQDPELWRAHGMELLGPPLPVE